MPKLVPLCLSFLMLSTSLPVGRAVQNIALVGNLIHHLKHHVRSDGTVTLLDLLALHYSKEGHHGSDHEDHHKLPFQHGHGHDYSPPTGSAPLILWSSQHSVDVAIVEGPPLRATFGHHQGHPSRYTGAIWQPPRA